MKNKQPIEIRFNAVQNRIHGACQDAQRERESVQLIAASKTKPAEDIRALFELGQIHYGENYVNEAIEKQNELSDLPLTWHYIGQIQSNKTNIIANSFDWVHGIDRIKIASRLNKHHQQAKKLNVLIQINLDDEQNKAGVKLADAQGLASEISDLPNLALRGLMALPKQREAFDQQRDCIAELRVKLEEINQNLDLKLDTISAGMSGDLEAAISAGTTMVRIGTDLFGARS